jgi:dTDP-4-dehydrorhamnose reductase
MKVIITGANGQLGHDVVKLLLSFPWEIYAFGREELDITDADLVSEKLTEIQPNVIIHAAAYTQVDQAESDEENAYLVNAYGTRNLVVAADRLQAKFCYISTDYVFNGQATSPYKEYDQTSPLGVYGKSKYAGEELVKTLCSKYFIVRTSWVYGLYGNNFVKTMLRLAQEKSELGVVNDQVGSPTYTVDLANFLVDLVQTEKYGVYHASNTGTCTWYEFAKAIFDEAGVQINVNPLTTEDFPRPAPRPKYSVMDHLAIRANGFRDLRHWKDGLKDFIKELNEKV